MAEIIQSRGTLFIDIDGTILQWSVGSTDMSPLPYAVEKINTEYDSGRYIVLTTMRGDKFFEPTHRMCKAKTLTLLTSIGLKYHVIVWDSPSPRVIINDEPVRAISHPKNGSWEKYDL